MTAQFKKRPPEPEPRRDIPQQQCRAAANRFLSEVRSAMASAKSEWRIVNNTRTMMLARIGAALKAFEKDCGL